MRNKPRGPVLRRNDFNAEKFKNLIWEHKKTLSELKELKKKGKLLDDSFVFDLEGVVKISAEVAKAFFIICQHTPNHQNKWANEKCNELARKHILEAFSA